MCIYIYIYMHMCIYIYIYRHIYIYIYTVGFHHFNLRIFNLRVPNPDKLIVDVFLTRCRISMCQGLCPKKHDENSEIDRTQARAPGGHAGSRDPKRELRAPAQKASNAY